MQSNLVPQKAVQIKQLPNEQRMVDKHTDYLTHSPCQFYHCKSRPSELSKLSSIKTIQISININQQPFSQLNHPHKFTDKTILPGNGLIQPGQINNQQIASQQLNANLFENDNPGLYYIRQVEFDPDSQKFIHNLVSFDNFEDKEKQLGFLSKQTKNITGYDPEKYSSKSGTTIIDLETQKEFSSTKFQFSNDPFNKQTEESVQNSVGEQAQRTQIISLNPTFIPRTAFSKAKQKAQSRIHIPQTHQNNHSQHCPASLPAQKQPKQFIVPIIQNTARNNKSKYKQKEYLNVKDSNLTKFFTTKEKKSYLDNVISSASTFFTSNLFNSDNYSIKNHQPNKFSKFYCNNSQRDNNFKPSLFCDSNKQRNSFNHQKTSDFANFTIQNTKFLVKTSPSRKHRKFFNQSHSTLINHNYRPLTSRKRPTLTQSHQQTQQNITTNISQRTFKPVNTQFKENDHNLQTNKQNCDYWAQVNSYKRMRQNSKKNIKLSDHSNQPYEHEKNLDIIKEIEENKENIQISSLKQSFIPSKEQSISKYKNSTVFEVEKIRSNNIKRVKAFQKSVMSRLSIVAKMGVKLPVY